MELGRNDPCWCGSGKKFKKCHLDRESQVPHTLQDLVELYRSCREDVCLFPEKDSDPCSGGIITAHSIQHHGQLSQIARNGQVYSGSRELVQLVKQEGELNFSLVPIKTASTFRGFCQHHDTTLFSEIENANALIDRRAVSLLAFRSIAREFYAKRFAVRNNNAISDVDKGMPKWAQTAFQKQVQLMGYALSIGIKEVEKRFRGIWDVVSGQDPCGLEYVMIEFDRPPCILVSGSSAPEYDFDGYRIQNLAKDRTALGLNVSILRSGNGTIAVLSYLKRDNRMRDLAESLLRKPASDIMGWLVRFSVCHIENSFFDPDWFERLDTIEQDQLREALAYNVSPDLLIPFVKMFTARPNIGKWGAVNVTWNSIDD